MDFITEVARTHIPNCRFYVGNVETLPGIGHAIAIYSRRSGATTHWPGMKDTVPELYPEVVGYYPSFTAFWKQCEKRR